MRVNFLCLIFLVSGVFVSLPSFALGKLGHQLVCQLAFEHLALTQQTKLVKLLSLIPENHQDLINHYNYKKKGTPISFANACTWADAIKRVEEFKDYASWHYMNVSRNQTTIQANDCTENCLPKAILQHQKLLSRTTDKSNWQQAQALLFLGHWLGDIHQPLHISFASDLGGNKVQLSHLATKCSNLHWYWDECILYRGKHSKAKWLDALDTQWSQTLSQTWQPKQVWQWANESFQLVKSARFNYCQMDKDNNCQQPEQKISLPDDYMKRYQLVMEQRLLLAAKRLAAVLTVSL